MADVAIGKNKIVYAAREAGGFGVASYPAGTDVVLVTGDGSFTQPRSKAEDLQSRPTLSRLPGTMGPYEVGAFNFPCYLKPSGIIATAPKGGQFLKALFGKETVIGGTSVTYSLAGIDDALESLTIVYKHGHIVYFVFGALVQEGNLPIEAGLSDSAIGSMTLSGEFLRMKTAGVTNTDFTNGYMGTNDFPDHWVGTTAIDVGDRVIPTTTKEDGFIYECTVSTGSTGAAEPTWPAVLGDTVVDGDVTWTCEKVSTYRGIWITGTVYATGEIITPTASNDYWYEFARAIYSKAKKLNLISTSKKVVIKAIKTEEYPTAVARPRNSILSKEKIKKEFNLDIRDWKEALTEYLSILSL